MKKNLFFILLLILIFPLISAVEIDMKSNYSAGETLIAKVSGSFQTSVLAENIQFYRGHVKVPIELNVGKINNDYYIYAALPEFPENVTYSIIISGVKYQQGNQISEDEIKKEFVISSQKANFTVNPGFVITKKDFSITIQNLEDHKIDISINVNKETKESKGFFSSLFGSVLENKTTISINSGEIKQIEFNLKDFNQSSIEIIKFSTESLEYDIPVYIFVDPIIFEEITEFRFEPIETNISIVIDSNKTKTITIYNDGNTDIKSITLSIPEGLKPFISLSRYKIDLIGAGFSTEVEMSITSGNEKEIIEGKISATTSKGEIIYLPVTLNFFKKTEEVPKDIDTYVSIKKCSELNGVICKTDETCSGKEETASDAKCCIGECETSIKNSSWKIIGFVIIAFVLLIIYWFFVKRFAKTKNSVNLLSVGEKK